MAPCIRHLRPRAASNHALVCCLTFEPIYLSLHDITGPACTLAVQKHCYVSALQQTAVLQIRVIGTKCMSKMASASSCQCLSRPEGNQGFTASKHPWPLSLTTTLLIVQKHCRANAVQQTSVTPRRLHWSQCTSAEASASLSQLVGKASLRGSQ